MSGGRRELGHLFKLVRDPSHVLEHALETLLLGGLGGHGKVALVEHRRVLQLVAELGDHHLRRLHYFGLHLRLFFLVVWVVAVAGDSEDFLGCRHVGRHFSDLVVDASVSVRLALVGRGFVTLDLELDERVGFLGQQEGLGVGVLASLLQAPDGFDGGLEAGPAVVHLAAVVHCEDDVLVELAMHRQLARLAEAAVAAGVVALERLLASVDVGVLFEVLREREALEAEHADVLLDTLVARHVAPQGEARRVRFGASGSFAEERSLHL